MLEIWQREKACYLVGTTQFVLSELISPLVNPDTPEDFSKHSHMQRFAGSGQ